MLHPRLLVLLTFLLGPVLVGHAQTLYWNPNATTPITGGNGTWDSNTTAAWNLSASGSASLITWSSNTLTANFRGHGGAVTVGAGGVTAGLVQFDATGYTLTGSVTSSTSSYIGYTSGFAGGVTFSGANSVWSNTQNIYVGHNATGALTVSGGAHVTATKGYLGNNAGIQGTATVTGSGSSWANSGILYVGNFGNGNLTVQNGGAVSNTSGYLAASTGTTGTATITGAGSSWTNSSTLFVGSAGTGTLTVAAGGAVTSSGASAIGNNAGAQGSVTVTGAGSSWTNNSSGIYVGNSGTGSLTVADQGTVKSGSSGTSPLYLGSKAGSVGTLNIGAGGAAGTLLAGSVYTDAGTGTVNFNHTDSAYTFAPNLQGTLAVNFLGAGTTTLTGSSNTYTGATAVSAGTLLVNGWVANSLLTVASGATLGGTGLIGSPNTTILSGGHLSPGGVGSPGTLSFTDDLTLNGGAILDFQLGTTSDLIRVSGGTLTGANGIVLNVSALSGFTAGVAYKLIDFGSADATGFTSAYFTPGTTPIGYTYDLAINNTTHALELTATASAIPEPATSAALAGLAMLGLALWRRNLRQKTAPRASA